MDLETFYWAFGFSAALFIGILLAFGLYIRKICNKPSRKRKRLEAATLKFAEQEKTFLKSINLDGMKIVEFAYLYEKRLKEDFLFKEFNAILSRYRQKNISDKARLKINEQKNIFENHIPYNDNIVEIGPKRSNYINASWISGSRSDKKFIITQVPLKITIMDFWNMIWMYNCHVIVMIGKEVADGEVIIDYINPLAYKGLRHTFSIEIGQTKIFSEFIKRKICLRHKKEHRDIIHLQFLTWSHVSVTTAQVILELRRQMKMEWLDRQGPIVVHCISGCGRSGTFVAISNICDIIDESKESRNEERISIPYEVINLREGRMLSVANLHQYSMIYETIVHYIVSGVTVIPIINIQEEMQFLSVKSSITGLTRFQRQFSNINKRTRILYNIDCSGALRAENENKNRIYNVIPRDCDRPYLKNICFKNTSDYINAVRIDSFNCKDHFYVTQWPMVNTCNDIWRLFYDKNIHVCVILDVFEHSEKYPIFWPNTINQSIGCGALCVKLTKDHLVMNSIRCQIFELSQLNNQLKKSERSLLKTKNIKIKKSLKNITTKEMAIFHLLNWESNKTIPDNLENVIDIVCLMEEYNILRSRLFRSIHPPIVLISKDGVQRAGVICVLSNCLETIHNYEEVDIYSAVWNVKRNRPQLIPTLEEYLLCYELCLEHYFSSNRNLEMKATNDEEVEFENEETSEIPYSS